MSDGISLLCGQAYGLAIGKQSGVEKISWAGEYEEVFPSTFHDLIMIQLKYTGVIIKAERNSSSYGHTLGFQVSVVESEREFQNWLVWLHEFPVLFQVQLVCRHWTPQSNFARIIASVLSFRQFCVAQHFQNTVESAVKFVLPNLLWKPC